MHDMLQAALPAPAELVRTAVEPPLGSLGPYHLLETLGTGGSATVYRAVHRVLGRPVAIKVLRPALAGVAEYRELFIDEARLACRIDHPNLLSVYDFDEEDGRPYVVMELVEGPTLAEALEAGPLPLSRSLSIAAGVADAVCAVHAAGVLHRDIKTENVVLCADDRMPRLIDFGIARPVRGASRAATCMGTVGTPRVMAPEQIARDPIDERVDIWALGVLLYETLTAMSPFETGGSIRDSFVSVLTDAPRPLPAWMPDDVTTIVDDCLRKEPAERPASAAVLRERLIDALAAYDARAAAIDARLA